MEWVRIFWKRYGKVTPHSGVSADIQFSFRLEIPVLHLTPKHAMIWLSITGSSFSSWEIRGLSHIYSYWDSIVCAYQEILEHGTSTLSPCLLPRTHSLYRTFFGLAMKMSIELGLHRKRRTLEISLQSELNKRLFWSCYSWDRELSIVMGRPPSISDHDIDAEVGKQTILITRTTLLTPCSSHLMLMKPFKTWKFSEKPPAKIEHDPHNHKQQCHVSFTFCDLRFLSLKSSTKYTG